GERPVHGRDGGLRRIALAPGLRVEGVADLVPGPSIRLPRTHLAQPLAGRLLQHREHAEALYQPRTGLLQELAPGGGAHRAAADVAHGVLVRVQFGVAVEVLDPRRAQEQAFGFDADLGGVQVGSRFTRVVICPWRSGGSRELLWGSNDKNKGSRPPPLLQGGLCAKKALMPVSSRPTTSW